MYNDIQIVVVSSVNVVSIWHWTYLYKAVLVIYITMSCYYFTPTRSTNISFHLRTNLLILYFHHPENLLNCESYRSSYFLYKQFHTIALFSSWQFHAEILFRYQTTKNEMGGEYSMYGLD
jgi:hypothetical protein